MRPAPLALAALAAALLAGPASAVAADLALTVDAPEKVWTENHAGFNWWSMVHVSGTADAAPGAGISVKLFKQAVDRAPGGGCPATADGARAAHFVGGYPIAWPQGGPFAADYRDNVAPDGDQLFCAYIVAEGRSGATHQAGASYVLRQKALGPGPYGEQPPVRSEDDAPGLPNRLDVSASRLKVKATTNGPRVRVVVAGHAKRAAFVFAYQLKGRRTQACLPGLPKDTGSLNDKHQYPWLPNVNPRYGAGGSLGYEVLGTFSTAFTASFATGELRTPAKDPVCVYLVAKPDAASTPRAQWLVLARDRIVFSVRNG
jgi:hypothetical protein